MTSRRVAAIDCGTNSIRLLVADVSQCENGMLRCIDMHREMRIVRLGQVVDATGLLAPEALDRTKGALVDYAAILANRGVSQLRMVATSAIRDAVNREEFFTMTREILGQPAELISGMEEARLSFAGAVSDRDPQGGPFLIADVGGGSTELVLGSWNGVTPHVHAARSIDIGCVRLTERCLPSDPPTQGEIATAVSVASEMLGEALAAVLVGPVGTFIGVAGTVSTLSAINQGLSEYDPGRIHGSRMSVGQVREVATGLLGLSRQQRAKIPSMHPGRVDVISGGALVVRTLAEQVAARTGITEIIAGEHDILDGVALSLV